MSASSQPVLSTHREPAAPSQWVTRWARLLAPGARVLDLACGSGRHLRWLAAQGFGVTGVDRDAQAVTPLHGLAEIIVADLEGGPWPLSGRTFDAVVVTNYLWRARLPNIVQAVGPGGVLLYETFARGQELIGRPSRPEFLLQPGELLGAAVGLRIIAYEDGFLDGPPRFVQRVCAVREVEAAQTGVPPVRRLLAAAGGPAG
jgi:SAM-dependent methyltransferase